jgi:hypothetical protein
VGLVGVLLAVLLPLQILSIIRLAQDWDIHAYLICVYFYLEETSDSEVCTHMVTFFLAGVCCGGSFRLPFYSANPSPE